jgi:TRAP-type uncharacterized transport system substrate-binding protein
MKKLLLTILLTMTTQVFAADDLNLVLADDSSSGTYKKMLGEIIGVCSTEGFNITEATGVSGGAPGNLDALVNNQAQAAFLHSDVFLAHVQQDPTYKRFQTLVALYPEPIHIITLKNVTTQTKNMFGLSSDKAVVLNTLSDLKGMALGAAGGGVYTARILKGMGDGPFTVSAYNSGKEVLAALDKGEVKAALFVGAAPLPNVMQLDKTKYKIIPVGDAIGSKLKGIYRSASVNYPGLTQGPVQTIAPIATIMTRKFNTPKKVQAQKHFRDCFHKHLDELKDSGSPNWQQVESNDHGVLDWYEIK